MKSLHEARKAVELAEQNLKAAMAVVADLEAKTLVRCDGVRIKGCGQAFEVRELEYEQTHWYESPHGCTGGDTWHRGEGQWHCPKCGALNRLYNKPDIERLKHLFKSVKDVHER